MASSFLHKLSKFRYMVDLSSKFLVLTLVLDSEICSNLSNKSFRDYDLHPMLKENLLEKFSFSSKIQDKVSSHRINFRSYNRKFISENRLASFQKLALERPSLISFQFSTEFTPKKTQNFFKFPQPPKYSPPTSSPFVPSYNSSQKELSSLLKTSTYWIKLPHSSQI
jgi:hypothetical protein